MKYDWKYDEADATWKFGTSNNGAGVFEAEQHSGYKEPNTSWTGNVAVEGEILGLSTYPNKNLAMTDAEREYDEMKVRMGIPNENFGDPRQNESSGKEARIHSTAIETIAMLPAYLKTPAEIDGWLQSAASDMADLQDNKTMSITADDIYGEIKKIMDKKNEAVFTEGDERAIADKWDAMTDQERYDMMNRMPGVGGKIDTDLSASDWRIKNPDDETWLYIYRYLKELTKAVDVKGIEECDQIISKIVNKLLEYHEPINIEVIPMTLKEFGEEDEDTAWIKEKLSENWFMLNYATIEEANLILNWIENFADKLKGAEEYESYSGTMKSAHFNSSTIVWWASPDPNIACTKKDVLEDILSGIQGTLTLPNSNTLTG